MVTQVKFYHNAENPLALACELAVSALGTGRKVALRVADAATARTLDQMLWTFDPLAFVPHVMAASPLASETPIIIGQADAATDWPHADMLFNLADDVPPGYQEFRSVVEIVGRSDALRLPARARWMHYKQRELPLQAIDAVRREAP